MKKDATDLSFLSSRRTPVWIGVAAIAALVLCLGIWGTQAGIDGAVVASGRVIVERNRQVVQHPDGGVVAEVLVEEGKRVQKGDILVRLDPTLLRSELVILEGQLYELMARRGRLTAERDGAAQISFDAQLLQTAAVDPHVAELVQGQRTLFDARLASFTQSIGQMENQKQQLREQIIGIGAVAGALATQISLAKQELGVQEQLLTSGLVPISRVLALQRESARLSGATGETAARRAQALERIAEVEIQMAQLHSARQEEANTSLRDFQVSELEMAEKRGAILTRLDRMDIRAPATGIAYDVRLLGAQSVLRPAEALLFLIPQDRPLLIECRVSPINVGSVHVGQDVVIRFPSFDMRQTPDLIGQVTKVSPDAFTEPGSEGTFYRIEVMLPDEELAKLGETQVVIPGMPVDAFLRTGEYTPLAYLTRPLTRYMNTAMRNGN